MRQELSRVVSLAMEQLCPGVSYRDILLVGNRLMLEADNGGIRDIISKKIARRRSAMASKRWLPGQTVEDGTQGLRGAVVFGIRGVLESCGTRGALRTHGFRGIPLRRERDRGSQRYLRTTGTREGCVLRQIGLGWWSETSCEESRVAGSKLGLAF